MRLWLLFVVGLLLMGRGPQPPAVVSNSTPQIITQPVKYPIVYVRAPRFGDTKLVSFADVYNPGHVDPGWDLMLLQPDGTEVVLVVGGAGAVVDPFISFDGLFCYYAYIPNAATVNARGIPRGGSDIYKINLQTKVVTQLTHQEYTPNNPLATDIVRDNLVFNLGPTPAPGGRIIFTSTRNGLMPTHAYTTLNLQLFIMDADGDNVFPIMPMTLGSSLHPFMLKDGRLAFSSYESQGLRDTRLWGLWASWPDGRQWQPLFSAFMPAEAFHFSTELSSEDIVSEAYYNLNDQGFGSFYSFPAVYTSPPGPRFSSAFHDDNPPLNYTADDGVSSTWVGFSPKGLKSLTPFTLPFDTAAPLSTDKVNRVGKVTMPSNAPNNDLLLVWTPGPANIINRPTNYPLVDSGIYLRTGGAAITSPADLILIKNSPNYNELWPRAVVAYSAVFGVAEPVNYDWLPNDGKADPTLPAGTPYGIIGTGSLYNRESFPGFSTQPTQYDKLDVFNTKENGQSPNWGVQGGDSGKYANSDIAALRIVLQETSMPRHTNNINGDFVNAANEKLRILGELPVSRNGTDSRGDPDTSVWARIPADTPFTFQLIDKLGMVLAMAQTWHQVRPGEKRTDCGGCHAHSSIPVAFEGSDASKQPPVDLTTAKPTDVEFYRDVRPLLTRSCVSCHKGVNAPGNLQLDDTTLRPVTIISTGLALNLPGDYARLAADWSATYGYKPVIGSWRQTNLSRYVRAFQSRRSLLAWKIHGARLDGWQNGDHPTETVPGDPTTLPPGADPNLADLDYTGTIMPPPGSAVPALSAAEKLVIDRWIDLGAPISLTAAGWFLDEQRPTLVVSTPRPGINPPLTLLRVSAADAVGLQPGSLSITLDVAVAGKPAGAELVGLGAIVDGVWTAPITVTAVTPAHLTASVRDLAGNVTKQVVKFTTTGTPIPPIPSNTVVLNQIRALLAQIATLLSLIQPQ